ncbi:MAG: hypothetical protein C0392_05540 [Syntrophus sp. (in: bacteria)]|nr:hypothetical protein [Syntrophus sp. (in: bacteria)]
MICVNCGSTNKEGNRFCTVCGSVIASQGRHYCRHCGKEAAEQAVFCVSCGASPKGGRNFCHYCGSATNSAQELCIKCGMRLLPEGSDQKDWLITLLLCVFLGYLGIHRFYTGHIVTGVIQILTCGGCGIWTLIDLIMIATGSFKDKDGNVLARK